MISEAKEALSQLQEGGLVYEAIDEAIVSAENAKGEEDFSIAKMYDAMYELWYAMHLGDADEDGNISISDLTTIKSFILGRIDCSEQQLKLADVDKNGSINVFDLLKLKLELLNR